MNQNEQLLKESLIFQMSLGSKELFHSNVWAWLIENDPLFIKVFFEGFDFSRYKIVHVDREKYHRDLIIWVRDKLIEKKTHDYYVIENKIKSLPTEAQLQEYSVDIKRSKLLGAVITGLEDYLQNKEFDGIKWEFVSYESIADGIERVLENSTIIDENKRKQILEYCEVVRALQGLIYDKLDEIGDHLLVDQWDENKYKSFNELRIADLLKKANGAKFVRYLINHGLKELETPAIRAKGYRLLLRQGFHNNKVTIDIFFTNANADESDDFFIIGTQTEGNQFRHVVCRNGSHSKERLFSEMVDAGWFDDDYSLDNRFIFGHKSRMRSRTKYDTYNPNAFVYQHFDIRIDETDMSAFEKLFHQIKTDMIKAQQIILAR